MDSVPYIFCEDVLERQSTRNLFTMTDLSGQWRSAAQRFLEKRRSFYIIISKDDEGWFYAIGDEKTRDIENGPHSHEEFLSMDRRYIEVNHISVCFDPGHFHQLDVRKFQCSKEEIARRVVPFLTLRMRPNSTVSFLSGCPKEFTLECLDMFRSCFSFGNMDLVYVGPESEEFLALQLKNNPFLHWLVLRSWPHTETTEQLLLTFLNSRRNRTLDITQLPPHDIQSPLNVTMTFVKAAVDSWVSGDEKRTLFVCGSVGATLEEILSIPVPENVKRTEEEVEPEEEEEEGDIVVVWTKEDGSSLQCELYFSHDRVSIGSSDN
ncbi:hypothetical protein QR680_010502 [Steinernema hermaphroditum]|uniref:Uncharacterized protein n=1 Tax=Steinernema hermaphroditum TaxID=289476 RepID=A0AA39IQU6_9BILA|nr:hypothetical protein QR680_010502 [Steinernema hermaphroditum]